MDDPAELGTALERFDRGTVAAAVRPLYRLSNGRAVLRILWSWAWIALSVWLAVEHGFVGIALAWLVIPGRQVGLFFLVHEAAHHRMFESRVWSDRLVNLFAGFPIGIVVDRYRTHHIRHHRYLDTEQDPDWLMHQDEFWRWPKAPGTAFATLAKGLFGLYSLRWLPVYRAMSPWSQFHSLSTFDKISFLALVVALVTGLTWFGGWGLFALLWIVPIFTTTFVLHLLRTVAEHLALPSTHELDSTRTVLASPLERFFLAPFGVNFHLEHHLFPGVPAYRLARLHRLLMQVPDFRTRAHLTRSYLGLRHGLLGEITRTAARRGSFATG